jgi:hypothetical protein
MKTSFLLIALSLPLWAQQDFDFRSLDKLDAVAKNRTKVTLDSDMLRLAAGFLGMDKDDKDSASLKSLADNLKGIYIRTYEFEKDGQYSESDVAPLRAYLKQRQWSRIVESREGTDLSEVYVQPLPNGRFGGVAIVSTESRELTVVYISGTMSMSDLAKLSGNLGVPEIDLTPKGPRPAPSPAPDKKKED